MRFSASYDEYMGASSHKELGASNDLQELRGKLIRRGINACHCIITEYDLENLDFYGNPEIVTQARLVHIDETMKDLSEFIIY